jgi:hypothetical protein
MSEQKIALKKFKQILAKSEENLKGNVQAILLIMEMFPLTILYPAASCRTFHSSLIQVHSSNTFAKFHHT